MFPTTACHLGSPVCAVCAELLDQLLYFFPASRVAIAGYWFAGLWTTAVLHYYLISLTVALPAIFIGRVANRRLHGEAFFKYVYAGLLCIGIILLVQAIRQA
jgi:uncharacterized protein